MRKVRFTVIYIENEQLKHKQINAYHAQLACEDFEELNPNSIVLEAGLGSINKEAWKEIKAHEKEIIKDFMESKEKDNEQRQN